MTLIAQAPNAQSLWKYDGSWTEIRGPASNITAGGAGLVAIDPSSSEPWFYTGIPDRWEQIGEPGWSFAVSDLTVYRLATDRQSVWAHNGGTSWTQIGGPASAIYAGAASVTGGSLVATNPSPGDLWSYSGVPYQWEQIGGPGAYFAVGDKTVYGLSPNRGAVFAYDGSGMSWTQIGGPAQNIYVGGYGLVATDPSTGNLYRYSGAPNQWEQIGGPGAYFAVDDKTVYGLSPDRQTIWAYDGSGMSWTRIGGAASYIIGYTQVGQW